MPTFDERRAPYFPTIDLPQGARCRPYRGGANAGPARQTWGLDFGAMEGQATEESAGWVKRASNLQVTSVMSCARSAASCGRCKRAVWLASTLMILRKPSDGILTSRHITRPRRTVWRA